MFKSDHNRKGKGRWDGLRPGVRAPGKEAERELQQRKQQNRQ